MKITTVLFAISMSVVLVSGQFFGSFDNAYRFGYDSLNSDFNSPNSFGGVSSFGGVGNRLSSIRDPRQNRGPVTFPDPPTDGPVETSGVIVGASGYGFVPPSGQQQQSGRFRTANRFNNRYFNQFRFI